MIIHFGMRRCSIAIKDLVVAVDFNGSEK